LLDVEVEAAEVGTVVEVGTAVAAPVSVSMMLVTTEKGADDSMAEAAAELLLAGADELAAAEEAPV
jgi:hypothetical protein